MHIQGMTISSRKILALMSVFLLAITTKLSAVDHYDVDFSSYLGGNRQEAIREIAIDSQGNYIVTAGTGSTNFPTTPGAFQRVHDTSGAEVGTAGALDVFVTKYSPTGDLIWSTLVGGPNYDRSYSIRVDSQDNIIVAGIAGPGFPTTAGTIQPQFASNPHWDPNNPGRYGHLNGFVFKLHKDGQQLLWSTYIGSSSGAATVRDMDVDADDDVYMTLMGAIQKGSGALFSNGILGYSTQVQGISDGIVCKISADGSTPIWSSFLGGNTADGGTSIRVDRSTKAVYVVGNTNSTDFPTPNGYQTSFGGGGDGALQTGDCFLVKFAPNGKSIDFGTYLGGSQNEGAGRRNLELGSDGTVYIAHWSQSNASSINILPGAFQTQNAGGIDFLVWKFSSNGQMLANTFFGGPGTDGPEGITTDSNGNVLVIGSSSRAGSPLVNELQNFKGGNNDITLFKLSNNYDTLLFSTHLGGSGDDQGRAIAINAQDEIAIAGSTSSNNDFFPLMHAHQAQYAGGATDCYISKLNPKQINNSYQLSVNNGTGSGDYTQGTIVNISAIVPANHHFVNWSGQTVHIANTNAANTTVTMPATAVSISANIKINSYPVQFNLDGKATHTGGGQLTQQINHGSPALAPIISADSGWTFTGWDVAFNNVTTSLTVTAQFTQIATPPGIDDYVALYTFDNANAIDSGPHNNHGSLNGSISSVTGISSNGINLISNDVSYVQAPYPPVNQTFTYAFWMKSTGAAGLVCGNKSAGGPQLTLRANGSLLFSKANSNWIEDTVAGAIAANTWHHIAISFDVHGDGKIYIDGQQQADRRGLFTGAFNWSDLRIGYGFNGISFDGSIDEFFVFDRALSTTEIQSLANGASAPVDSDAPSAPNSLTAIAVKYDRLDIAWNAATDNIGVARYEIHVGNHIYDSGLSLHYQVNNLQADTFYDITVYAFDAAGNQSAGTSITAKTGDAPKLQTLTVTPTNNQVSIHTSVQFTALGFDQYNDPITISPVWLVNGVGSIDSSGLYQAGSLAGTAQISATDNGISTIANVVVNDNNSIPQNGLVAYYSFDNGDGDDLGPQNLDGTSFGSVTAVPGAINNAVHLDGNHVSYFQAPYPQFSQNTFSYAFWMRPSGTAGTIFGNENAGGPQLILRSSGSLLFARANGNWIEDTEANTIVSNMWQHIVVTFDSAGDGKIYIDGVEQTTRRGLYTGTFNQSDLRIGHGFNGASFDGSIDEFTIYNRVLNNTEIQLLSNAAPIGNG